MTHAYIHHIFYLCVQNTYMILLEHPNVQDSWSTLFHSCFSPPRHLISIIIACLPILQNQGAEFVPVTFWGTAFQFCRHLNLTLKRWPYMGTYEYLHQIMKKDYLDSTIWSREICQFTILPSQRSIAETCKKLPGKHISFIYSLRDFWAKSTKFYFYQP